MNARLATIAGTLVWLTTGCAGNMAEPGTPSAGTQAAEPEEDYPDSDLSDEEYWAKVEAEDKATAGADAEEDEYENEDDHEDSEMANEDRDDE